MLGAIICNFMKKKCKIAQKKKSHNSCTDHNLKITESIAQLCIAINVKYKSHRRGITYRLAGSVGYSVTIIKDSLL